MALRVTREQEPVSSGVWIRRRQNSAMSDVIAQLEATIQDRKQKKLQENSYTASLFKEGTARIAQKVGEEGVEVAIASLVGDDPQLISEMADLILPQSGAVGGQGPQLAARGRATCFPL